MIEIALWEWETGSMAGISFDIKQLPDSWLTQDKTEESGIIEQLYAQMMGWA